ncbi:hypothetical protein [Caulobacter mirabilis]|uniref:Thioredoxin domain-containing protein n=1 Tax=Caulobacter mirabilis TaxID=69666 RepID=A0A2D2ASQ8_9CAUL|nr:hypothetical protein [Caulobacter mirabilis]ATQ41026.1 hypothetical protein CSW64_00695 [Caulobacter mirabilis]
MRVPAPDRRTLLLAAAGVALGGLAAVPTAGAAPVGGQPVRNRQLLARLQQAPWTGRPGKGGCAAVYALVSTTCPYSRAFMAQAYPRLVRQGYDVQLVLLAVDGERKETITEAAFRRDPSLIVQVFAGRYRGGLDPADSDEATAAFNAAVAATLDARALSRAAGFGAFVPSFLWRDRQGQWRIYSGFADATFQRDFATLPPPGC